jgi:hypothetical protein
VNPEVAHYVEVVVVVVIFTGEHLCRFLSVLLWLIIPTYTLFGVSLTKLGNG